MSTDVVIVGGGVIGLSLAWQLAGQGRDVTVLDKQQTGREASWAGAGILPPDILPVREHRSISSEPLASECG